MYEFLKQLCKERNTNISQLCTIVTGNSGNLATWKKGYMRSDYLAKCADVLGVSTDYILQRVSEEISKSAKDSKDDDVVLEFRQLDEAQKQNVISYIKFLQSQPKTNADIIREAQRNTQENLDRIEALKKETENIKRELQEKLKELSDI